MRRDWLLAFWWLLLVAGLALVAAPGDWLTASINGRHLMIMAAAVGIVFETERRQR